MKSCSRLFTHFNPAHFNPTLKITKQNKSTTPADNGIYFQLFNDYMTSDECEHSANHVVDQLSPERDSEDSRDIECLTLEIVGTEYRGLLNVNRSTDPLLYSWK